MPAVIVVNVALPMFAVLIVRPSEPVRAPDFRISEVAGVGLWSFAYNVPLIDSSLWIKRKMTIYKENKGMSEVNCQDSERAVVELTTDTSEQFRKTVILLPSTLRLYYAQQLALKRAVD